MAQLSANHLRSFRIESSVTDSTPDIIDADLHPSFDPYQQTDLYPQQDSTLPANSWQPQNLKIC